MVRRQEVVERAERDKINTSVPKLTDQVGVQRLVTVECLIVADER